MSAPPVLRIVGHETTTTTVEIRWIRVPEHLVEPAGRYVFMHYQVFHGGTLVRTISDVTTVTHSLTGLSPAQSYELRVVARLEPNAAHASPPTGPLELEDTVSGTTDAQTASTWLRFDVPYGADTRSYARLGAAADNEPRLDDEPEYKKSLTLTWSPVAGAVRYDIVQEGPPPSSVVAQPPAASLDPTAPSHTINDLKPATRYRYRIEAHDASGIIGQPEIIEQTTEDMLTVNNGNTAGSYEYTDGSRTVLTKGKKEEIIQGDHQLTIASPDGAPQYHEWIDTELGGAKQRKTVVEHSGFTRVRLNDTELAGLGFEGSYFVGLKASASAAISTSYDLLPKYSWSHMGSQSHRGSHDLSARNKISLRVLDPSSQLRTSAMKKRLAAGLVGAAAGATAYAAAAGTSQKDTPRAINSLLGAATGALAAVGSLLAVNDYRNWRKKGRADHLREDVCSLVMNEDELGLAVHKEATASEIKMTETQVFIRAGSSRLDGAMVAPNGAGHEAQVASLVMARGQAHSNAKLSADALTLASDAMWVRTDFWAVGFKDGPPILWFGRGAPPPPDGGGDAPAAPPRPGRNVFVDAAVVHPFLEIEAPPPVVAPPPPAVVQLQRSRVQSSIV